MKKNALILALFLLAFLGYFHEAFLNRLILAHGDGLNQYYPILSFIAEQYRSGTIPLWNSQLFTGFPLMAASHYGVLYPPYIIPAIILPIHIAYNLNIVFHYSLAGFFTFLYTRQIGLGKIPSFFAGITYAFTGYLLPHVQHVAILHAAVWLPLVLYFFERIRLRGDISSALMGSLAVAFQVYAGHPQVLFYSYIVLAIYVINHAVSHGNRKRFVGLCALTVLVGLLMGLPQLYATQELSSMGVRSGMKYEEFASYSLTLEHLPRMMFPAIFGKDEAYFSFMAVILAMAAMLRLARGNPHVRLWSIITVITFILALGDTIRPLHRLMYDMPLYNLFRGPIRHLVEFNLCIAVLSAFGVSMASEGGKTREVLKIILIPLALAFGGLLVYFLSRGASWLIRPSVYVPLILVAAATAFIAFIRIKGRHGLFVYVVFIALVIEIISFRSPNWFSVSLIENYVPEELSMLGGFNKRTAFLTRDIVPNLFLRYNVNVLTEYDPMVIEDLAIMMGMGGVGGVPLKWELLARNNLILSMFNTRYLFVPESYLPEISKIRASRWDDGSMGRPVISLPKPGYPPVYKVLHVERNIGLVENLNVMPRAYSVTGLFPVDDIKRVWAVFYSRDINPRKVATVSENELREIGFDSFSDGEVWFVSSGHYSVTLGAKFSGTGFVVLSDQHYPGWQAYIDGVETRIFKANGVMRGIVVPAGIHEIVFEYFPLRIYILMALSALTLSGVLIMLFLKRRAGVAQP